MFNRGYMAGGDIVDGIRQGVDGLLAARAAKQAAATSETLDLWIAAYNKKNLTNAANFAEKHALRAALSKLDPSHPLVTNKALQEKIQDAGERIAVISDFDYDAISKAGRDFKY